MAVAKMDNYYTSACTFNLACTKLYREYRNYWFKRRPRLNAAYDIKNIKERRPRISAALIHNNAALNLSGVR